MKEQVPSLGSRLKIVVYSLDHETNACAIIRILAPMIAKNFDVVWATKRDRSGLSIDLDIARKADVIIIQRHFPAAFTEKALRTIVGLKVPIVYDLDDMFLDVPPFHPDYNDLSPRAPYIKWILKEADLVTVSTTPLQEALKKYTTRPIHIQPNLVDWSLFDAPSRPRNRQFNLLVSGTPTHQGDWSIIEEPLAEILNIHRDNVNAIFFGELPKRFSDHPAVRLVNFQADYRSYASRLRELDIHAALVPLEDTKFNRCKSNIKWLEYSAAGIAGVFSNILPYNSSIRNSGTGLLVNNTADAWFQGMEYLLANPEATFAMIENARREVREHHSIGSISDKYLTVFNDLLGQKHVRNLFSELPILPARLGAHAHQFLDRHILWRFNRKH